MADQPASTKAYELVSVHLMNVGYGIFFALVGIYAFLAYPNLSHARDDFRNLACFKTVQFIGCVAITLTLTPQWMMSLCRTMPVAVWFDNGRHSVTDIGGLSGGAYVVYGVLTVSIPVLADFLLTYRLWVVWSYSRRVVLLPLVLLLAALGMVCKVMTNELRSMVSPDGVTTLAEGDQERLIMIATYAIDVFVNMYCGALIIWKLYHTARCSLRGGVLFSRVAAMLVESMALYTASVIFALVAYIVSADAALLALNIVPVAAGIAFAHICVRVEMGRP